MACSQRRLLFVANALLVCIVCVRLCDARRKPALIDDDDTMAAVKAVDDSAEQPDSPADQIAVSGESAEPNNVVPVNGRRKSKRLRKYQWMRKEVDILADVNAGKAADVECHKAAVWRCGHVFIRAHKFLDYIKPEEAFQPKCALRTAFFSCLKTSKIKSCHRHRATTHTQKFRKRLADTLWSTRACLLGVKST